MIDFNLFRNKRVLITGHTGFKGSWLSLVLQKAGAVLDGLALPPNKGDHFLEINNRVDFDSDSYLDIREYEKVVKKINDFQPEIIFHLAAQALVKDSYSRSRETFETNFMGGVNLLESVKKLDSLRGIVFVTSDKAYENLEWEWGYRENDMLGGRDPYSASKGAVELAVSSYSRTILDGIDIQVVTARAGNVVGGGDWSKNRIVPDVVRSIRRGESALIRNPNSTRPWQHVLEPLSGYLLLAQRILEGNELQNTYNFGPDLNQAKTVLDVAQKIIEIHEKGSIEVVQEKEVMHEASLLQLNCERAKLGLGWAPRWDFEKTIDNTANWYKFEGEGRPASELTDEQISEYFWELS